MTELIKRQKTFEINLLTMFQDKLFQFMIKGFLDSTNIS